MLALPPVAHWTLLGWTSEVIPLARLHPWCLLVLLLTGTLAAAQSHPSAASCEASLPVCLALAGLLEDGVRFTPLQSPPTTPEGPRIQKGQAYRAKAWALVVLELSNPPGQQPWSVDAAWLTRSTGAPARVRSVKMNMPRLEPGQTCFVVVEVEAPDWDAGEPFTLGLKEKDGQRHLPAGTVIL